MRVRPSGCEMRKHHSQETRRFTPGYAAAIHSSILLIAPSAVVKR